MRKYPFAIVSLVLAVFLYTCSSEDNSPVDGSGGGKAPSLIVKETPKRATTDVRDSYGIFTLSTDQGDLTDYHLAVKETTEEEPNAEDMSANALKRNISTTEIHVLIAQRLNAPMVTFAKQYFADQTKQQLGTGMSSLFDDDPYAGFAYDNTATGTDAWVAESVLKPSTAYTLYGMPSGGAVVELLNFSTDATPDIGAHATADVNQIYLTDTTLEKDYLTLSVNADEYYMFPIQGDYHDASIISLLQIFYSLRINNNAFININMTPAGSLSLYLGYDNTLWLFANAGTNAFNLLKKGHILIKTQGLSSSSFYFGITYSISTAGVPDSKYYSTLSIQ